METGPAIITEVLAAADALRSLGQALPLSIARWLPGAYAVLGTDGYGLSESRAALRAHFEVSKDWIVFVALSTLAQANKGNVRDAHEYRRRPGWTPLKRCRSRRGRRHRHG